MFLDRTLVDPIVSPSFVVHPPRIPANRRSRGGVASIVPRKPAHSFRCPKCGREYRTKYTCSRHTRLECGLPAKYWCSECDFRSKHKHNLKQHFESVHLGKRLVVRGGSSGDDELPLPSGAPLDAAN